MEARKKREREKMGPKIAFCSHGNHQNETERGSNGGRESKKKGLKQEENTRD